MSKAPDNNKEKSSHTNNGKSALTQRDQMQIDMFQSCLENDMLKMETIEYLYRNGNLDPLFTCKLWERMERRCPETFRALYERKLEKMVRVCDELQRLFVASTSKSGNTAALRDQQGNEIRNNEGQTLLDNPVVKAYISAPGSGTMKNEKPENPKKLG